MVEAGRHAQFDLDTELGRDYAAVDWSASAVGPPEGWPDSLRTTFSLMTASRFAMWMAWGDGLTFFCNDTYRRDTLGRKYPWALGRPATEVWAEIWPDVGPLVESVLGGAGATWDEGMRLFLERSGYAEETYHTFSYSPLVGDDGLITGMLCVVSEDTGRVLSQRRIAALGELAARSSAASTEAEVFAAVGEALGTDPADLPFALGYLSEDGGARARLAFTSGIEAGHPAAPLGIVLDGGSGPWATDWPADGRQRRVDDLTAVAGDLPTGAWAEPPVQALVTAMRRPGGEIAGALVVGMNPHRPIDADYAGFVSLVADQINGAVTRGRTFDAQRRRAEEMAELDRAKTTFFTNVSHELRTPLTLLLGPAEDALADPEHELGPAQRRRVEVIQRNAERLLKLVNTLLDFSRLEAGQAEPHFEPVALDRLTAELASMFESAFARTGLTFRIDVDALDVPFHVDREMWAKIVLNLVSNALKATFTGGVEVALRRTSGGAELSVRDTGVGIEESEQGRLFERFHRVAGAVLRSHEGSGIGLALVAELVELHGGKVRVDSTPGVGSTFTVTVPEGIAHLPPTEVFGSAAGPAGTATASVDRVGAGYLAEAMRWVDDRGAETSSAGTVAGRRILVVDDNADMRGYIVDLLVDEYTVVTASDGAAALATARAEPPDLVLTDVMMPVLDGFGLLRELREDPATQHIPVVMLSARSGDEAAVEGLEAGADDYLIKPFSQRELLARVRANLELDRVRRVADDLARSREMLAYAEGLAQVGSFEYDALADSLHGTTQFFELFGLDPQDVRRDGLATAARAVHDDDVERVVSAVRAGLDGDLDGDAGLDLEFAVGEGGTARTLWLRGVVERTADTVLMRGSVQDITARLAAQLAAQAEAAAREVAAREHAIAHELQQSLLPARSFDADHLDIAAFYRAGVEGTQVGGDWYDVIELGAGRTALVLGDVMGRGIQAAAVMGQLRATVRAYARLDLAPDTLMHLLDDAVREIRPDMIVTCVYAVYDPAEQTLTYANAGHLPPLLLAGGEPARRLTQGGPPLGAGRAWGAPETVTLPTGALLTLYTDGLVEQRGTSVDDGIDRLAELLRTAPADVQEVPAYLARGLLPEGHDDDVALLVACVSERAGADRVAITAVPADIAAVGDAREFAAGHLEAWGVDEGIVDDVRLIVSELVTNAVLHGEPPIELRVRRGGNGLLIEVQDTAAGPPQLRRAAPDDNHGRGLMIVATLSDRWGTRPTQAGKSVWCQLRLL